MNTLKLPDKVQTISLSVGQGTIEIVQMNIDRVKVDAVIGYSSVEAMQDALIDVAGCEVKTLFNIESLKNPASSMIITPPGDLQCKAIFFVKWLPSTERIDLEMSLENVIWNIFQAAIQYDFKSIGIPTIGFEHFPCPMNIIIELMIKKMKTLLIRLNRPWNIIFSAQRDQPVIYEELCKQLVIAQTDSATVSDSPLPNTWDRSKKDQKRFVVPPSTSEYQSIIPMFDQAMKGHYSQVIRLERIQNERWYLQYVAHSCEFKERLHADTEKRLYHGCPETSANSIIEQCFNRSYAGVNGIALGAGVYFSTDAAYSHSYTRPNAAGERCMFLARVLIGRTTSGNSSMKTAPSGFDSTSSGHAFVTYHDAQAYAEYLITYK